MTIQSELLALKTKDGLIIPEQAVSWAAKNPASKLYQSLEWDDATAGHQFRLWQVRRLVSIYVVNDEGHRSVVSLSVDRTKPGGGYRDLNDVLPVADLRNILLQDALAELERVQQKYERLSELAEVWAAKDRVKTRRRAKQSESSRAQLSAAQHSAA